MSQLDDSAYTIHIDPARKFVEISMRGHWDDATIKRFISDLRQRLQALPAGGCRFGEQNTLFDTTAYAVQSQEVLAQLGNLASDPTIRSRKVAVLVSSMLIKMQARRIAPRYGFFEDRDEALRWLFEPDA